MTKAGRVAIRVERNHPYVQIKAVGLAGEGTSRESDVMFFSQNRG
jgi:hypothetical protein